MCIMLIISSYDHPEIIINKQAIKYALSYGGFTFEENCKRRNFDYELFNRVYNNDLTITLQELIKFAKAFEISLSDFVILC